MNKSYFEIDYEIEAVFDKNGDFPLKCAALLFDLLKFHENIVIKNRYVAKKEAQSVLLKHIQSDQNDFYAWPEFPKGDYCLWIKSGFSSNQELMDILRLQGMYLSYIVPSDSFEWDAFLKNWREDERYLLSAGQAPFVCNVIDMDRKLNINFSTALFSTETIMTILNKWEKSISVIADPLRVKRTEMQMRSKHGNKYSVCLRF